MGNFTPPIFINMDSLTQVLIGIATAELCAGKKLHRRTYAYGAILGTLPDLDVVAGRFMDPVAGVAIHRGLSHSLLFFMLLSPLLGLLIARLEKGRISWRSSSFLVFCCLATHVLIDLFTSWGTQVLWPLPYRVALKTIFVIDPLFTVPLLVCLVMAWRRKEFNKRKKYVLRGLYISSAYLLLTCGLKLYVLQKFEAALKEQNISYRDLLVKPTAFNCILWNANVATKDAYLLGDYSVFDSRPITFKHYKRNLVPETQLKRNPDFETLKDISEGWYIVTLHKGSYYLNDLRFGLLKDDPAQPQFAFSYVFIEENGVLRAKEVAKQKRDGKELLKKIFNRITD